MANLNLKVSTFFLALSVVTNFPESDVLMGHITIANQTADTATLSILVVNNYVIKIPGDPSAFKWLCKMEWDVMGVEDMEIRWNRQASFSSIVSLNLLDSASSCLLVNSF